MAYKNKQDLYDYQIRRWILRKHKAIEYLGGQCKSCGYNKYYGALHFHHRNSSEKEMVWNQLRLQKWDNIVKELDKCDLLCANCHSETHALSS